MALRVFDSCSEVPVQDVVDALITLGYLDADQISFATIEHGYITWLGGGSGIDPTDGSIELVGPSMLSLCPEGAWAALSGQAIGRRMTYPEVTTPAPSPYPNPLLPEPPVTPPPPSISPHQAVFGPQAPQTGLGGWLIVAGLAVGAWWLWGRRRKVTAD